MLKLLKNMKKIFRITSYLIKLIIAYICACFIKLFNKNYRNVWIVSERGIDARDNGYHFFKYLNNSHPEIKSIYIIDSNSADYKRVSEIGECINYNSFKHFLVFALAKVRISSSVWGGDVPIADYYKKLKLQNISKKKVVFLQHGITKDYLPSLMYPYIKIDLFVCGARPEYEYINNYFNHPSGVVKYTGFARFDSLNGDCKQNHILIMPTFRKYEIYKSLDDFKNTEFYKKWMELLNNEKLFAILENTNTKLIFYPHIMFQKYIGTFYSSSKNIVFANFDNYDVQDLLKSCKMLITDYSSVFFDIAYMNKPIIYYQFDKDEYINKHYDFTKGYFNYEKLGFGKVAYEQKELLSELESITNNNFKNDDFYSARSDYFFEYRDKNNCERIYNAIMERINE